VVALYDPFGSDMTSRPMIVSSRAIHSGTLPVIPLMRQSANAIRNRINGTEVNMLS